MNNVLILQSYSSNINDMFELTIQNHQKYCNANGYSLFLQNEQYNPIFDLKQIIGLSNRYDIIMTIGTDCIFTNFNIKIENLIDGKHYLSVSKESRFSAMFNVPINGEIMVFNKKNDEKGFINFIQYLNQYQNILCKTQQYGFTDQSGIHFECSTQAILNTIYMKSYATSYNFYDNIEFVNYGKLQSFVPEYVAIRVQGDEIWKDGDFLTHTFGIPNNQKVLNIKDFFEKHPDLR